MQAPNAPRSPSRSLGRILPSCWGAMPPPVSPAEDPRPQRCWWQERVGAPCSAPSSRWPCRAPGTRTDLSTCFSTWLCHSNPCATTVMSPRLSPSRCKRGSSWGQGMGSKATGSCVKGLKGGTPVLPPSPPWVPPARGKGVKEFHLGVTGGRAGEGASILC